MDNPMDIIDKEGLLFLLTQLYQDINAKSSVTISTEITNGSTNDTAAGTKAVYDFVTAALADITHFSAVIVESLPDTGDTNKLYLVAKASGGTSDDGYDEYLYIGGKWEKIGSTNIDLSGYLKKDDIHVLTNSEITEIITSAKGG